MSDSPSVVFSKIISEPKKDRPLEPEKIVRGPLKPIAPPADHRSSPIEQLLDFVINHWHEPTISVRNMRRHGPNSIRASQKDVAIKLAGILVEHGWLSPIKSRRRDMLEWKIARKPSE